MVVIRILAIITSVLLCQVFGQPIIGGDLSKIEDHPWLVSIQTRGQHFCGGSIISATVILTAAHCIPEYPLSSLGVRVGSSRTDFGGSWHKVVATKRHENYTDNLYPMLVNDLALMKVSPPITIQPLSNVAKIELSENTVTTNTSVTFAGWGSLKRESSIVLEVRSTSLRIMDSGECSISYEANTGWISEKNEICAVENGRDSCRGDSGGPLVAQNIQVGISSWGSCADPRYPAGVYTDVARYRHWIEENSALMRHL